MAVRPSLASHDPATGAELGRVDATAPGDVAGIVEEVSRVQPLWATLRPVDRARYLLRAAQWIIDDLDPISELIAREQGRPRTEALTMELLPSVEALHWLADEGPGVLAGERLVVPQLRRRTKRARLAWDPLGVVGTVTGSTAPWAVPVGAVGTALMAGNGVVLKPGSSASLLGARIGALFADAGLPDGLVRVAHGGPEVAAAVAEAPVAHLLFAGSETAGRRLSEACGRRLAGSTLALGHKGPAVVLADAPLERAVSAAAWGAFAAAGQGCSGIARAYCAREVADRFADALAARARSLLVGDPRAWETDVGPLAGPDQLERVEALVREAVSEGATVRCGGPVSVGGLAGAFYAPAVVTGVRPEMRLAREEAPGPVLPVIEVASADEALVLAGAAPPGLTGSVWTEDREGGERVARQLPTGSVWINAHGWPSGVMALPWGDPGLSGQERMGGRLGLQACARPKVIGWEGGRAGDPRWYPYDRTMARAARAAIALTYGRETDRPAALRASAVPLLRVVGRLAREAARR